MSGDEATQGETAVGQPATAAADTSAPVEVRRGRFVILTHDVPFLHWDLLLENGRACKTWRLLSEPSRFPLRAELIGDHRLHYLDYEGPVSKGRGHVVRWDCGTFETLANSGEKSECVDDEAICAIVSGDRLQGRIRLRRAAGCALWEVDYDAAE